MSGATTGDGLADRLAGIRPFGDLGADQLALLAAAASVITYAPGDLVVDAFIEAPSGIFVVLDGEVDIWQDADRVNEGATDRLGAGDVIGFSAMLTERPVGPRVVAATTARMAALPGTMAERAFHSPAGARFLAEYVAHARIGAANPPVFSTVEDLIASPPLVVDRLTPVSDIGRCLRDRGLPCAVVELPDGQFGLVTDAMLSRRVVAEGMDLATPAYALMDYPAPTIAITESAAEALVELLDASSEYLLVVDPARRLRGFVDARDFVLSPTTAGSGSSSRSGGLAPAASWYSAPAGRRRCSPTFSGVAYRRTVSSPSTRRLWTRS